MRLIDADALMADLEKWMKQIDPTHPPEDNAIPPMEDIIVSTLMTIEEQPTIDPQRTKGRWKLLPGRDDEHIRYLHCSVCHFNGDYESNFCPNCGADMRGEQHG